LSVFISTQLLLHRRLAP